MQMNPSLILQAGQTADIMGAMSQGNALAQQQNEMQRQNALAGFMRDNGAALMQGDRNALAGYAQYDPAGAMQMQQRQQDQQWQQDERAYQRQRDQRQDSQQDQEWQWKVQEYAAQKTAAERAAEAQQIEDAVKMGLAAPDAATWDAMVTQAGAPDLVGQFDNRKAIGNRYLSVAEILKGQQPAAPLSPQAKFEQDKANGFLPANAVFQGGGTTVNVGQNGSEFDKAFGKSDADTIAAVSDAGIAAQRNLGRIDQLASLMDSAPQGWQGAAVQRAGEWGVNMEGLDQVQALQAAINSLVPEQRQPGSGPMSDADLDLFKQSLPRVINQPGGNQIILEAMRGIAQYDAEGAQIAQELRAGRISREQAFDALQRRKNPLAAFSASGNPAQRQPAAQQPVRRRFNPQTGGFE